MWGWIVDHGIWILIVSSLAVILLLFFNERVKRLISRVEPDQIQHKFFGNITAVFWTIEAIAVIVMIMAFVAVALAREGTRELTLPQMIEQGFLAHGPTIILILVVGIVLWIVLKQTIPPLVRRVMSRPVRGESREGLRRRADTLQGVFLGLGRIIIILMVVFMILSELSVPIGPVLWIGNVLLAVASLPLYRYVLRR